MVHKAPVPFLIDSVDMASLDYIAVFALHIPHRPMLYASFSSFPTLLPSSLQNVSSLYVVGLGEGVRGDADLDSRMYEVGRGYERDSSLAVT
jgi:hypothetical protein